MPDIAKIEEAQHWLKEIWPGGQHVLPHWQDGPYWLVPMTRSSAESYHVSIVLDAHDPLATGLPFEDGSGEFRPIEVYALGQFAKHMSEWYNEPDVDGLELHSEHVMGPYDAPPSAADVVAALPLLLNLDHAKEQAAPVLAALQGLDPAGVLVSLAAIYDASPVPVCPATDDGEDDEDDPDSVSIIEILSAVAGVSATRS